MSTEPVYVGMDVSQDTIDVAVVPGREHWTVQNTTAGIAEAVTRLAALQPTLVVLEVTGGLERGMVVVLHAVGISVAPVNPSRIRAYAKALGQRAKTDRIDAEVIALFAQAVQPPAQAAVSADLQACKDLLARRSQLVGMISAEKNRLHRASPCVKDTIQEHIAWLGQKVDEIDQDLSEKLTKDEQYQRRVRQLRSVKGVGPVIARAVIVGLPELGRVPNKQISALVGVAPYNRDSGKHRGPRFVHGGRPAVRSALFIAAMVASRWNPDIRAFYQRLLQAGKCKMVALTACAHKLLLIMNAMVRHDTYWQPATAHNQ